MSKIFSLDSSAKKPIPAKYAGKLKPRRVNIQTIEQK